MALRIRANRSFDLTPYANTAVGDALAQVCQGATATLAQLQDAYEQVLSAGDPELGAQLQALAQRAFGQPLQRVMSARVHRDIDPRIAPYLERAVAQFKQIYFGQDKLVQEIRPVFELIATHLYNKEHPQDRIPMPAKPRGMVISGRYRSGKTFLPYALSRIANGDPAPVHKIAMGNQAFGNSGLTGAPAGFVGYGDASKLSEQALATTFQPEDLRIVVLDDMEKIPNQAKEETLATLGELLDSGVFPVNNSAQGDGQLHGALVIGTTNCGVEEADRRHLSGGARDQLIKQRTKEFFGDKNTHVLKRTVAAEGVLVAEDLDRKALGQIIGRDLAELLERTERELLECSKRHVALDVSDEALQLLAQIPKDGGMAGAVVSDYVARVLDGIKPRLQHGEVWQLRATSAEEAERFSRALAEIGDDADRMLPAAYKDATRLPLGWTCVVGAPELMPFAGALPDIEQARASGTCNGYNFYLAAAGGEPVKLYAGEPGDLRPVALPDHLARCQAMSPVQACILDDHRVLAVFTDCPAKAAEASVYTVILDFQECPPGVRDISARAGEPPPALAGAVMGAVQGDALFGGGRLVQRKGEGWSVPVQASPGDLYGKPINADYWRFDGASERWQPITAPGPARFGAAAYARDGKLFIACGEELSWSSDRLFGAQRAVRESQAVATQVAFEPTSDSFREVEGALPHARVFPQVREDGAGGLLIGGGFEILGRDRWQALTSVDARYDALPNEWIASAQLPAAMATEHLACLPMGEGGCLLGPFDGAASGMYAETRALAREQ